MEAHYKSWVPTVSGRLSFSAIGNTSAPSRCVRANVADSNIRFIICYQSRVTSDITLPLRPIFEKLLGLQGRLWFVCVARTESVDQDKLAKLTGSLFLFHTKDAWKSKAKSVVRAAQYQLWMTKNRPQGFDLEAEYGPKYQKLLDELGPLCASRVGFELFRNGETTIVFDDTLTRSPLAPALPNDGRQERVMHALSAQLFFFLKDITHTHQHHDAKTDTIVDLHRYDGDDVDWRIQVLYSLYRKIIQYKRKLHGPTVVRSLGILAYAGAFEKVCRASLGSEAEKLPTWDRDSLKFSLETACQDIGERSSRGIRTWEILFSAIFGALGAVIAIASLRSLHGKPIPDNPSETIAFLSFTLYQNTLGSLIFIAIIISSILYLTGVVDVGSLNWARVCYRWFQALKRKVFAWLLLLFAAILIGVAAKISFHLLWNLG